MVPILTLSTALDVQRSCCRGNVSICTVKLGALAICLWTNVTGTNSCAFVVFGDRADPETDVDFGSERLAEYMAALMAVLPAFKQVALTYTDV